MKRDILLSICVILCFTSVIRATESTQEHTLNQLDSITNRSIYFRQGSRIVDPFFEQNGEALKQLGTIFSDTVILLNLDSVRITATASPDGNPNYNRTLAIERAQVVKAYIIHNYPHIEQRKIFTHSYVKSWSNLGQVISAKSTPYYSQIASILDQHLSPQQTESRLRTIDGGRAWAVIVRQYLPKMRSGTTVAIYTHSITPPPTIQVEEPTQELVQIAVEPEVVPVVEEVVLIPPVTMRRPLFALKTNLLYDAMTALNIEIEIPIGQHWSVAGEYIFPWWLFNNKRCLQSLSGYVEGRYWFGDRTNRRQLTGWFAGAYVGGGNYDVQWGKKGYQGEFIIPIALSAGYAHSIGRNLSMEYSLGFGYMRTSYNKYELQRCPNNEEKLIRACNGTYNWIGPTRLKISLVYMINSKKNSQK